MKRRRLWIVTWMVMISGIMSLLVAGCGADPTPTPRPTPTPTPTPQAAATSTPTPEPSPEELFEARWNELIAAAQEEGEVHFLRAVTSRMPVLQAFETKFGIRTVPGTAGGRASTDRVLAERTRGRYTVDISNAGAGSSDRLVTAGALIPVWPEIFHPDAVDASKWRGTPPFFADREEKYLLAWSFRITDLVSLWYNTDLVSQEEIDSITSYWDLLKPEFEGRFAIQDPSQAGRSDLRVRAWQTLGPEFIEAVIRAVPRANILPARGREASEGLARGKFDFVLFASTGDFEDLETIGIPITALARRGHLEGGLLAEVGAGTDKRGLFDQAPHPNAARLFLNWFLTQEGQTAWNSLREPPSPITDGISLRNDVPQGLVRDDYWAEASGDLPIRGPNAEYYQALDESLEFMKALYEELGYIF